MFAEQGYRGASTRDIAKRADVIEVVIYGNFGTKANLFEEAVFVPLRTAVTEFIRRWTDRARADEVDPEQRANDYIAALHELFWDNRRLLRALVAAAVHDPALAARLRQMFNELTELILAVHSERDSPDRLYGQILLGAVLTTIVHENVIFSAEGGPDPHTLRAVLQRSWPRPNQNRPVETTER